LVYHRGSLYLVGRAPQYDELRHWKVDRMQKADLAELRFNLPEGFDLHRHLKDSFGVFHGDENICVRVRFSPEVATYVLESKWHDSQKLVRQKDGSVLAEFQLSHTEEIKRWILSFGANAVVLEPKGLRKDILTELQTLADAYSQSEGEDWQPRTPTGQVRFV
jgi:predicted DNA-binding transcriptional regulator YafY